MTAGRIDRIGNDFELFSEKLLGTGGAADIYLGRQLSTGREVAIKVIRVAGQGRADQLLDEAKRHLRVGSHPNIVTMLAAEHDKAGRPCFVLEKADCDLRRKMAHRWPSADVTSLLRDVLSALVWIHRERFIHRDLKPENILVFADRYKLSDFGASRSTDEKTRRELTPSYASPETLEGRSARSSDLYSLGFIAYELLLGRYRLAEVIEERMPSRFEALPPRVADVADERSGPWLRWHASIERNLPPPHELDPSIPRPLSRTVAKLARKDPDERPPSPAEALRQLDAVASGEVPPRPAQDWKVQGEEGPRSGTIRVETIESEPQGSELQLSKEPPTNGSSASIGATLQRWIIGTVRRPRRLSAAVLLLLAGLLLLQLYRDLDNAPRGAELQQRKTEGLLHVERTEYDEAAVKLRSYLEHRPDDQMARYAYAKAEYYRGDYATARGEFARLRKSRGSDPTIQYYSGLVEAESLNWAAAVPFFEAATADRAHAPSGAFFDLGLAQYKLGQHQDSLVSLRTFLGLESKPANLEASARTLVDQLERRLGVDTAGSTDTAAVEGSFYELALALRGIDRPTLFVDQLREQPAILHLWASWCEPCLTEMPALAEYSATASRDWARSGLRLFVVSVGDHEADVRAFLADHLSPLPSNWELYWDPSRRIPQLFLDGDLRLPQTLFLNGAGLVVDRVVGPLDWKGKATQQRVSRRIARMTQS